MIVKVKLGEVVPLPMLEANRDHIRDFLEQEGITSDPDNLAATEMTERQVKQLLEELAEGRGG